MTIGRPTNLINVLAITRPVTSRRRRDVWRLDTLWTQSTAGQCTAIITQALMRIAGPAARRHAGARHATCGATATVAASAGDAAHGRYDAPAARGYRSSLTADGPHGTRGWPVPTGHGTARRHAARSAAANDASAKRWLLGGFDGQYLSFRADPNKS
jgi:hypothetical protein